MNTTLAALHVPEGYINDIAFRAMPCHERPRTNAEPVLSGLYQQRISRWIDILGSEELLRKRLLCHNLTVKDLPSLLAGPVTINSTVSPWCNTFSAVLAYYTPQELGAIMQMAKPAASSDPLPFEEILFPFILHYRRQLAFSTGDAYHVLTEEAIDIAEQQLLSHLSFVAGLSLGVEYYQFRFNKAPASAIEEVWMQQPPSRIIYDAFVEHMYSGGILSLFNRYPVLARLLCQSADQFAVAMSEFCKRFDADFTHLKDKLNWQAGEKTNAIAKLITNLSDRHNGGRTVFECILCTGESVIYKPRSIRPEISFYHFIDHFNEYDLPFSLKKVRGIDKEGYGWVEKITAESCSSIEAAERFYTRAGMLLAVLHVLSVTDVHFENLIAHGEYPVVVDLETLLDRFCDDKDPVNEKRKNSVLRTGLLPRWKKTPAGQRFDMSGLGADELQDSGIQVSGWVAVNTDQMQLKEDTRTMVTAHHRIQSGDEFPTAADHLPAFLDGFKQAYRCLFINKENILANTELLNRFDGLELRALLRDTNSYASMHLHLLHPEYLKDGIDRSIELEWLARPLMGTEQPSAARILVYELERQAMEQLDVPHFTTAITSSMPDNEDDEDFAFLYRQRDATMLRANLERLSMADHARQRGIIERAIRARYRK